EALKTLAGTGLVTMSPYRGATVRAIDDATARQIYDMRLLLEPEAVRRAVTAPPGPGGLLAAAREALERADAAPDQAARSLANREFHRALYLDCGNPRLTATPGGRPACSPRTSATSRHVASLTGGSDERCPAGGMIQPNRRCAGEPGLRHCGPAEGRAGDRGRDRGDPVRRRR